VTYRQVLRLARAAASDCVRTLIRPENARAAAAQTVVDRAWGKAPAHAEVSGEHSFPGLRIEYVAAPQHSERGAIEANPPRVIEAIELDPRDSNGK